MAQRLYNTSFITGNMKLNPIYTMLEIENLQLTPSLSWITWSLVPLFMFFSFSVLPRLQFWLLEVINTAIFPGFSFWLFAVSVVKTWSCIGKGLGTRLGFPTIQHYFYKLSVASCSWLWLSASEMEDWKSLVARPLKRQGGKSNPHRPLTSMTCVLSSAWL